MTYALARPGHDDPYRVARQVPLAVLPGVQQSIHPWRCPRSAELAATLALVAFDRVIAAAESADRRDLDDALPVGVAALGTLAKALAPEGAVVLGEQVPPGKLIHAYFGVRHHDDLPRASVAFHAVLVARWCIAELQFAALDANDVLAELLAWRTVIAALAETPLHTDGPSGASVPFELLEYLPDGNPWDRWVVAHHGYLLLNMLAAASVGSAVDCITSALPAAAEPHLRNAAVQVRGITATMIHSAALPGRLYLDEIRPSMAPPGVPKPLTGGAFFEHHHYHRQIRRLLDLTGPYDRFALCFPALAALRDDLLDSDIVDLERHITMGYTLVRDDRSLVQQAGDKDAAVPELRRMRDQRVREYAPYMRFGAEQA